MGKKLWPNLLSEAYHLQGDMDGDTQESIMGFVIQVAVITTMSILSLGAQAAGVSKEAVKDAGVFRCAAVQVYRLSREGVLIKDEYQPPQDIVVERTSGRIHSKSMLDDRDAQRRIVLHYGSDQWSFKRIAFYSEEKEADYFYVSMAYKPPYEFISMGHRGGFVVTGKCND